MSPEQYDFRRRAVRAALIVAGIAVAIGLVIGGLTSAAINLTGVLPEPASTPTPASSASEEPEEELPTPSLASPPTPSPSPSTSSPTPSPSPSKTRTPKPDEAIELRASANSVDSFERVTLSGSYHGGNGTSLQVQRREGGAWASFPTSATVEGGTFSTYVELGQPGTNRLRVVDPSTGKTSNVVVVAVS